MTKNLRKKMLIITPSIADGGAEKVLSNLLHLIDYSLLSVDLFVGVRKRLYSHSLPEEVRIRFLFKYWFLEKMFIQSSRILISNFLLRLLANVKIKDTYDVGISFVDSKYTDLLIGLGAKVKRRIAWVHASIRTNDNYSRFYKGNYIRLVTENRYKRLDLVIFVSYDSRMEFIEIFGDVVRSKVIYNILDTEGVKRKALESVEYPIDKDRVNIVAVGHLHPVKAFDRLINAAKKLKDDGRNFMIRILGCGYCKNKLSSLIKSLEVEDYVELLGFRPNPYPFMKEADIFVMTSISEALPVALCEAMILGLPCVVTNSSGCKEIVQDGRYGIITEKSDTDIYMGLKQLIDSPELRKEYKNKALERAEEFDDIKVLEQIYSIL